MGQVQVFGSALPAVRVELNPDAVNKYNIGIDQIATVLDNANANQPKGEIAGPRSVAVEHHRSTLQGQQLQASGGDLLNGAQVRVAGSRRCHRLASRDIRNVGGWNGQPSISILVMRQPNANIIDVGGPVKALIPQLQAALPPTIHLLVSLDRTVTIRASVHDVEVSLMISVLLVVLVVFVFLRSAWATFIPSVAVPISLLGTFGLMYLVGYSVDNLSLMALTISTGFVVDDAIVVIENITRYLEQGMSPWRRRSRAPRDRFHGGFDERFADSGVHSRFC